MGFHLDSGFCCMDRVDYFKWIIDKEAREMTEKYKAIKVKITMRNNFIYNGTASNVEIQSVINGTWTELYISIDVEEESSRGRYIQYWDYIKVDEIQAIRVPPDSLEE